jgi:hypothetical protein
VGQASLPAISEDKKESLGQRTVFMSLSGQVEIQQAAEYSGWRIVQSSGLHLRLEAKDFFFANII